MKEHAASEHVEEKQAGPEGDGPLEAPAKPTRFNLTVKEVPFKQPPMEAVVNTET